MLDAPLIIKGFVNDEPECNYELYLTEFINHSELFKLKSKGSVFHWVEHQNCGEPDAASENYRVDFKLLATRSSLQGLREVSGRITKLGKGAYAFGVGRWPEGKPFTFFRTAAVLRQFSTEDLNRIACLPVEAIERDVSIILKSLRVKKNILLFYPYTMMFSEPHTFESGCNSISEAFNEDLYDIGVYRRNEASGFDTYLCVFYEKRLLIFELIEDSWVLKDFVEMGLNKTYMDLFNSYVYNAP